MKKILTIKKVICIVLIALLLITTNTYAASDSFNTTIQASSSRLKEGENLVITIGLKDIAIESGEKGIGAYTASIKFDNSVLEYVSTNGTDKWEAPLYQNGLIVGNTKDGQVVNTAQSIATITFKVKKGAKAGETTIELTNFSGSTAVSDVKATANSSVKIAIEASSNTTPTPTPTPTLNNNTNTNIGINNSYSNNTNTLNSGKLPKTGVGNGAFIICITSVAAYSVFCFIKMKKIK